MAKETAVRINCYTGVIEFDTPLDAAEFWWQYMKRMIPGLEEQCKKIGEDYAQNVLRSQLGTGGRA